MKNDKSNHGNCVFWSLLVSDSQTSQDSSGSQIEEPTGPGATSKFLQKWQIDFEPLFSSSPDILDQNQPHSDLRHTSKYRFPKFWLKTVESSYVFGRSKWRDVPPPPNGIPHPRGQSPQRCQEISITYGIHQTVISISPKSRSKFSGTRTAIMREKMRNEILYRMMVSPSQTDFILMS